MSTELNTTKIYDETAAQIEAAYLGFARVYEVQHPRPVMQAQNTGVFGAKHIGLLLALVGSIIVSASHTIPIFVGVKSITDVTFGASLVIGFAAFVMIEIGIVTLAYSATENAINRDEVNRVRALTNAGKWFVSLVMFVTNVYYVLQSNIDIAGQTWETVRIVIYLAVGSVAPVVAIITGEILAIDVLKHRSRQSKAQEQYNAQLATWIEALNEQWKRDRRNWGANVDIQVSKPVQVVHSLNTGVNEAESRSSTVHSVNTANERTVNNVTGYSKQMNARDYLKQWFADNPEYIQSADSVDVLHKLFFDQTGVSVGRTSVYNVRKELQK